MGTLTIELPPHAEQTERNLRRWAELVADPEMAKIQGRVETDRYGHVIMSPPPPPSHGSYQSEIGYLLRSLLHEGRVITECPLSTADGVKVADVAWASPERIRELGDLACFPRGPEICIEVLSPSNTPAEMRERKALYFDAGAREVWFCDNSGTMRFFLSADDADGHGASEFCPKFPERIELR